MLILLTIPSPSEAGPSSNERTIQGSELNQIHASLTAALKYTEKLKTPKAEQAPAPIIHTCPFLTKFPPEIRNNIYGYLLANPKLGDKYLPSMSDIHTNYHLSLEILRTNRQVYTEASKVLYETHDFSGIIGNYFTMPFGRTSRFDFDDEIVTNEYGTTDPQSSKKCIAGRYTSA